MSIEWTNWCVHFCLAKLVQVPEKFKHMSTATSGEGERRTVILEVLAKSVPVTAFLVFIAAACGGRARR